MIVAQRHLTDVAAVAAHYDDLDLFYRNVWGGHIHHGYWITGKESVEEAILNLTHLVARQARIEPGHRVWDAGCGYGASALIFAREYGAQVTGMTVSKRQCEIATSINNADDHVRFICRDALNNGLPSGAFDSVVAIESSEHMEDKPRFFAEAMRLLRPQGRLAVAAWLTRERPRPWESAYLLGPICAEGRLPSMASASEYRELLLAAGFRRIVFEDLTRNVRKTWTICAFRFIRKMFAQPCLRRRLLDPNFANRVFVKTILRIWLAYKTGSMRYGLFSAVKP